MAQPGFVVASCRPSFSCLPQRGLQPLGERLRPAAKPAPGVALASYLLGATLVGHLLPRRPRVAVGVGFTAEPEKKKDKLKWQRLGQDKPWKRRRYLKKKEEYKGKIPFRVPDRVKDARLGAYQAAKELREYNERRWEKVVSPDGEDPNDPRRIDYGGPDKILEKKMMLTQLNGLIGSKHRKSSKTPPQFLRFANDWKNPWFDRYMLCKDCERAERMNRPIIKECGNSTLLELDMSAPFSRDNVMVTSCKIVQLIREGAHVMPGEDGKCREVPKPMPGSFEIQVCATCRKTTLEEKRGFMTCQTCFGVHYCSEKCYADHRMTHRAHCNVPILPIRQEWGVRNELKEMRAELYPVVRKWAISPAEKHRVAWLPPPEHIQKKLNPREVRRPVLAGFGNQRLIQQNTSLEMVPDFDGQLAVTQKSRVIPVQRPQKQSHEPDQSALGMLGLTIEEWRAKNGEIIERKTREDDQAQETLLLTFAEETSERLAIMEREEVTRAITVLESQGKLDDEAMALVKKLHEKGTLTDKALARIEEAAREAPEDLVNPDVKPPWELIADQEAERLGGRREWVKKQVTPDDVPDDADKKEGVVYKRSYARRKAKAKGFKLSEEALQRLEEAAAITKGREIIKTDWLDPILKYQAPRVL